MTSENFTSKTKATTSSRMSTRDAINDIFGLEKVVREGQRYHTNVGDVHLKTYFTVNTKSTDWNITLYN